MLFKLDMIICFWRILHSLSTIPWCWLLTWLQIDTKETKQHRPVSPSVILSPVTCTKTIIVTGRFYFSPVINEFLINIGYLFRRIQQILTPQLSNKVTASVNGWGLKHLSCDNPERRFEMIQPTKRRIVRESERCTAFCWCARDPLQCSAGDLNSVGTKWPCEN